VFAICFFRRTVGPRAGCRTVPEKRIPSGGLVPTHSSRFARMSGPCGRLMCPGFLAQCLLHCRTPLPLLSMRCPTLCYKTASNTAERLVNVLALPITSPPSEHAMLDALFQNTAKIAIDKRTRPSTKNCPAMWLNQVGKRSEETRIVTHVDAGLLIVY
jgi:hypothetical protein